MKKWMTTMIDDDHQWLHTLSEELDISGSFILQKGIARLKKDKEFKEDLMRAQIEAKMAQLNAAKARIETELKHTVEQLRAKVG